MKKVISIGVKPLAMATALIAGTSASMIAAALPGGGDTLGAAAVTTETTCQRSVDMTISSAARSVTTGTGACQIRTLPPTVGFVLTNTTPAGTTVGDSGAMVSAGGELYEAYVGGNRDAAVLLTPNRALATSRAITFAQGTGGSSAVDFAATVQPAVSLDAAWMTGTYRIASRNHDYQSAASGMEMSNGVQNFALSEFLYTKTNDVTFNGDGTCSLPAADSHMMFSITKDPTLAAGFLEMDNGCTEGGGNCAQNDGANYLMSGGINIGSTGVTAPSTDFTDSNSDGQGAFDAGCTYSVSAGAVTVNYVVGMGTMNVLPADQGTYAWSTTYQVSADLRYLVSDGNSNTDAGGYADIAEHGGGIAVGVRVGSPVVEGKTYLFNALDTYNTTSTPVTASYENPLTPTYQQEKCASRGSLTLNAAGACTYTAVSTCNARFKSGYEESAVGANDGTITDSVTVLDGVPVTTSCSWSGTGANLVVDLGMQNQGGDPITMHYTGAASDNGEALVMQGIYNVFATAPDIENAPLLAAQQYDMQSYMVAQEYTGDLNANADADALTNLQEFTFATEILPTGGFKNDFNGSSTSDILWINGTTFGTAYWDGAVKSAVTYPGTMSSADTYKGSGDFDGNGTSDLFFYNTTTGATTIWSGAVKSAISFPGKQSNTYNVAGICDLNNDGNDDVLWFSASTGGTAVWSGAVKANVSYPGVQSTAYTVAACGDFNADGSSDIFWRNAASGAHEVWPAGVKASKSYPGAAFAASTTAAITSGDVNANGADDLFWYDSTTGTTVVWEGGLKSAASYPGKQNTAYTAINLADYDGDGAADIFWSNLTGGNTNVWPGASKATQYYPGVQNTAFSAQR